MLMLSLALHMALIMLIQPRPGSTIPYSQTIRARIVAATPAASEAEPVPDQRIPDDLLAALDTLAPPNPEAVPVRVPEPPTESPAETRVAAEPVPAVPSAHAPDPDLNPSRLPARESPDLLPSVPVMLDTTWYNARQLDVQPKARYGIEPAYPEDARRASIVGTVTLLMRINELGEVKEVTVESATPPGVFDASAKQAFASARFAPARLAGQAVRAEIRIRVTYTLND